MKFKKPPIYKTLPVKEISPVIANSFSIGLLRAKEIKEQVIATPADGPSFLLDPL